MAVAVLGFVDFTSDQSITATTEATAQTLGSITHTFDGTEELLFEAYAADWGISNTTRNAILVLYMDGNPIGQLWEGRAPNTSQLQGQIFCRGGRMTVSAGSHTFALKAYVSASATWTIFAGDGTTTNADAPGYFAILDMQGGTDGVLLESVGYGEVNTNVTVTSTSSAAPDLVVATASAVVLAADAFCWVEFDCCAFAQTSTTPISNLSLWDGTTYLGRIWRMRAWATGAAKPGIRARRRVFLTAGSHSLKVMGDVSSASTLTIAGGTWPAAGTDQANHIEVFREVSPAFDIDAEPGSYAITGAAATLTVGRALSATAGSYAVTGSQATLLTERALGLNPGAYAITGLDAALNIGKFLSVDAGAYAVTGANTGLFLEIVLDASAGAYLITGDAADLAVGIPSGVPGTVVGGDRQDDRTFGGDRADSYASAGDRRADP